jgi:SpoIID/LytB domain protein
VGREDARFTAAVAATRGELLVREDGSALVDAVYSAACGGHTEDNDRGWGGTADSALRGRLDADATTAKRLEPFTRIDEANVAAWLADKGEPRPYCARPRTAATSWRWKKTIDLAAAAERAGVGALIEVKIIERGVSGRAVKLEISGERGKKELRGELEIRRALGGLKSALFTLESRKDNGKLVELTASGAGHGHGIGMCQLGAEGMAQTGVGYRDILQHYYGHSRVKRMY